VGITELSNALSIDKSVVSRLVKKGMPTTSVDAAQAWRESNAPPRAKRGQRGTPPPAPKLSKVAEPTNREFQQNSQIIGNPTTPILLNETKPVESANTPDLSLKRAIEAEDSAHQKRKEIELNHGSIEDYRKANGVYIAARNNRVKAQKDHAEWERLMQITLLTEDAIAMFQRTFGAARQVIDVMPKAMAPRVVGQPQKEVERSLLEWCSRLVETMRANVWPKVLQP